MPPDAKKIQFSSFFSPKNRDSRDISKSQKCADNNSRYAVGIMIVIVRKERVYADGKTSS